MKKLSEIVDIKKLSIKELFSIRGGAEVLQVCDSAGCFYYGCTATQCVNNACNTSACNIIACGSNVCSGFSDRS